MDKRQPTSGICFQRPASARPGRKAGACLLAAASLSLFFLIGNQASGQTPTPATDQTPGTNTPAAQMLSSYEGQNVSAVEVAGRPSADPAQFSSLLLQKPGQPFSQQSVETTASALKTAIHCDLVRVEVEAEANGLRVMFVPEPAIYFGIYEFPGAGRFAYSRLVQVANYPTQTPFNGDDVEQGVHALEKFFQQQGYFQSQVKEDVSIDAQHALANVSFPATLGPHARFGEIEIAGSLSPSEAAALKHSLQTPLARIRGSAIRPGKTYHASNLSKATLNMQTELQKQGHLDAQVKLSRAEYQAGTNRADIHFDITPGPSTTVAIEGAHLWSWNRKALLPVYQGVGADDESVEEGRQALISYFQTKGFFEVKVDAQFNKAAAGDSIIYKIAKEKKHKVTAVTISGNSQLPNSSLTPHLAVTKSHFTSPGKFSERLVRSSVKNLSAVYRSEGFSSVEVEPKVVNRGGDIQVSFRVIEGPRDIVQSINIEGADTFPQTKFAPGGLKLAAGQPYSQQHVAADRASIVAHYLQAGYLTATFRETANQVSKADPHHINVVYHIYEGPKVNAAETITLGRNHTQQRLIDEDMSSIKPEQPLTESGLLIAGSKLYDHPGVFDWAEVDPKRDITTQNSEDVLVKVHETNRNDLTYGFGFEVVNRGGNIPSGTVAIPGLPPVGLPSGFTTSQTTFYGPRGTLEYTRNNVGGKGDSLSFTGFAGRLDQRGAAYYIVPEFLWSKWKATTSVSAERNEENPIFSSQAEIASTQLQRSLDQANKDTLFLRYSFSQTDLTRVEIPDLVPAQDRDVRLSTLAVNVTRDTRDNPLDEHKGMLDSLELDFNSTKLGSSVDYTKLTAQAAYYKQGFHNIVWANSLRIGLAQPFSKSFVPLSQEFFTGGGNSLRGFPLDGAGPQRPVQVCSSGSSTACTEINVPSGGNELLLINSEARIPLPFKKGLGLAVFYDGGNVFPSVGFHDFTSLYSNNVGLGLRYATPVGPIRVDLGRNLNPIPGISATQYFISIGQAF
jgi:outer membrane protein insertion porin family